MTARSITFPSSVVSWPRVGDETFHRGLRNGRSAADSCCMTANEIMYEKRDILSALTERRNPQWKT